LLSTVEPSVELPRCQTHGNVICMQSVTAQTDHKLECAAFGKPTLEFIWTSGQQFLYVFSCGGFVCIIL